jgi:hypothetical protein
MALGDAVEFEKLPHKTAAWLCTKDKYNLPMFITYNCVGIKLKQKLKSELNALHNILLYFAAQKADTQKPRIISELGFTTLRH